MEKIRKSEFDEKYMSRAGMNNKAKSRYNELSGQLENFDDGETVDDGEETQSEFVSILEQSEGESGDEDQGESEEEEEQKKR